MLNVKYSSRSVTYRSIVEDNIDSTEYLESQLKGAIKVLETQKKIKIDRVPTTTPTGRIRKSIEENDKINFLSWIL